jgi:DNA-binding CsgD family transcriptional regulator
VDSFSHGFYTCQMSRTEQLYRTWLELAGSILDQCRGNITLPWSDIADLLIQSFDAGCCSWSCVDLGWVDHMKGCWPKDYLPSEPPGDRPPDASWQPLLRWYALTGETAPQTIGRIPPEVIDAGASAVWNEFADPMAIRSQISIPLNMGGTGHHAFVMSRPDQDFGDGGIAFARLLQPLLEAFFAQYRTALHDNRTSNAATSAELTVREMAVLNLLGRGMTASSIGHRLAISPRTVQKHLEHVYRKLDVADRLMAVQIVFGGATAQCSCRELNDGCCESTG